LRCQVYTVDKQIKFLAQSRQGAEDGGHPDEMRFAVINMNFKGQRGQKAEVKEKDEHPTPQLNPQRGSAVAEIQRGRSNIQHRMKE